MLFEEIFYKLNGFKNRDDYLACVAEDFGISIDTVYCLEYILGKDDFDLLISKLEEVMYLS